MLKLELNLTVHKEENHNRIEMLNLRNKVCHQKFKEDTTLTDRFTRCFDSDKDLKNHMNKKHNKIKNISMHKDNYVSVKDNE